MIWWAAFICGGVVVLLILFVSNQVIRLSMKLKEKQSSCYNGIPSHYVGQQPCCHDCPFGSFNREYGEVDCTYFTLTDAGRLEVMRKYVESNLHVLTRDGFDFVENRKFVKAFNLLRACIIYKG